jgi:hypothetical protein
LLLLALMLAGCSHRAGPIGVSDTTSPIELGSVPFFPQEDWQCGPAALATVLAWSGVDVTPQQLTQEVFLPSRRGSLQAEMLTAPARHGRLAASLPPEPQTLIQELEAGHPVLVLQNLGLASSPVWHYSVLVGFDARAGLVTLRSGRIREHRVSWRTFTRTWQRAGSWAMVVLMPGDLPATVTSSAYLEAALALERNRHPAAVTVYSAGQQRWPNEIRMSFGLANAFYHQGELGHAERALRMALQIDPDSVPVLNNLAQVLIDQGCPSLAINYAERALAGAGEWADQVQGTLEQARKAQDKPVVCRPRDRTQEPA